MIEDIINGFVALIILIIALPVMIVCMIGILLSD